MVVALLTILNKLVSRITFRRVSPFLVSAILCSMIFVEAALAVTLLRSLLPVSFYDDAGRERQFSLLTYEPHWHTLDRSFEWVRQNAPPGAVVATSVPHLAYLRTGRKAVLPPFELDPEHAQLLLDNVPVSYLVLDELKRPDISDRYAFPVVAQRPENWNLVFAENGTKIYERVYSSRDRK